MSGHDSLKLSSDLKLPIEIVTESIAILARKRMGKSYIARKLAELLFKAKEQIVVIDPKGDWWGIRASADGKKPGLPIIIIGGERGDVPLEPGAGEVVARLVVEERVSALLDLSLLHKHEVATFMAVFLESLYQMKARKSYRTTMMLVIDEADAIAPQKPQPNQARMLGAADDIVRRGGQRGIGCTLVTQRSAVLSKDVLTQTQLLVVLRTIAPQDIKSMRAWIEVHGDPEQEATLIQSLPALQKHHAWWWSPGWPTESGIFQRTKVDPIETFDSGATPKAGQKRHEPRTMADINLDIVRRQMAEVIERQKESDPKALKAEIQRLHAELAKKAPAPPAPPERIEVPAIPTAMLEDLRHQADRVEEVAETLHQRLDLVEAAWSRLEGQAPPLRLLPPAALGRVHVHAPAAAAPKTIARPRQTPQESDGDMGKGERLVLASLIQWGRLRREQITTITGYKKSTRDTYVLRLAQKGYADASGGFIQVTEEGRAALPSYQPLPHGEDLQRHWLVLLPAGEKAIFEVLLRAYPDLVPREEITEQTGYKKSTRDTYVLRLVHRELAVAEPGGVRANAGLFEEAGR